MNRGFDDFGLISNNNNRNFGPRLDDIGFSPNNRYNRYNRNNINMDPLLDDLRFIPNNRFNRNNINNDLGLDDDLLFIPNNRNRNNFNRKNRINRLNFFSKMVIDDISKLDEGNRHCAICLEDFQDKEELTALPCIHFFHEKCIKEWLKRKNDCPICKIQLDEENLQRRMRGNSH